MLACLFRCFPPPPTHPPAPAPATHPPTRPPAHPQAAERAPAAQRPALALLAQLYGLTRVERSLAFHLASGSLSRADGVALRAATHALYGQLTANGAALALKLCDGWGIPDHLLQAPIAFDWRKI